MTPLVDALALLAGALAMSIAVYLQMFGTDAPVSYAVGYYVLGSGIFLIVYEMAVSVSSLIIILGISLILLSEFITAYSVIKSYGLQGPIAQVRENLREGSR